MSAMRRPLLLLSLLLLASSALGEGSARSGPGSDEDGAIRCRVPGVALQWRAETGTGRTSVLAASMGSPLLATAAMQFDVSLIRASTGKAVPGWPFSLATASFRAPPVFFDIDKDGKDDVLLLTTDGEVLALDADGGPLLRHTFKLGALSLPKDWYVGLTGTGVRGSLSLVSRPVQLLGAHLPVSGPSLVAQQRVDWTGVERWLPKEGVESLSLFEGRGQNIRPSAPGLSEHLAGAKAGAPLPHSHLAPQKDSVLVPPHVLGPAVLADLAGDGRPLLLIPVSYYFDHRPEEEEAALADDIDPDNYVAGGLVAFDPVAGAVCWHREFDVATDGKPKKDNGGDNRKGEEEEDEGEELHAYMTTPPTVIDLDHDGRLEVVVATDFGRVYVLDSTGSPVRWGSFPLETAALLAPLVVEDLDGDGELELLVASTEGEKHGRLACYDSKGTERWATQLLGAVLGAPLVAHVDSDAVLDVVVGTLMGQLAAVRGDTGALLPNFPLLLGMEAEIHAQPRLLVGAGLRGSSVLAVGASDGHVYFVTLPGACLDRVDLGESVLEPLWVGDYTGHGALQLLASTAAGDAYLLSTDARYHPLQAWHAPAHGLNVHTACYGWQGVHFSLDPAGGLAGPDEVSAATFPVPFEIVDSRTRSLRTGYRVTLRAGRQLLLERNYTAAGSYVEWVEAPSVRGDVLLRLQMHNEHGQLFSDSRAVRFHVAADRITKWLLLAPLLLLGLVTFALRELPDLLPS